MDDQGELHSNLESMLGFRGLRSAVSARRNGVKVMQRICSSKVQQVHPDGLTRYPGLSSPNAVLRTIDWIGW
jgi:hypothetical protein